MIIAQVDNSDAASITNTLVTKDSDKLPRFFAVLTYASLCASIVPFSFSLIVVTISWIHSIPTILAYVFTSPFHFAALLIVWQHWRQIPDMQLQLPFRPSSWRSILYICFLAAMWCCSLITSATGARSFVTKICAIDGEDQVEVCYTPAYSRTGFALIASTVLAALEMHILCAMALVCYRNRPRNENPPTPIELSTIPSPKVLSA